MVCYGSRAPIAIFSVSTAELSPLRYDVQCLLLEKADPQIHYASGRDVHTHGLSQPFDN
jgi:hypothetical protein